LRERNFGVGFVEVGVGVGVGVIIVVVVVVGAVKARIREGSVIRQVLDTSDDKTEHRMIVAFVGTVRRDGGGRVVRVVVVVVVARVVGVASFGVVGGGTSGGEALDSKEAEGEEAFFHGEGRRVFDPVLFDSSFLEVAAIRPSEVK
jgi:hypothetical protein